MQVPPFSFARQSVSDWDLALVLARQPYFQGRQNRDNDADRDIDDHGVAVLEPEQPRRYDKANPGKKKEPFFPDRKSCKRGDRQHRDDDADDRGSLPLSSRRKIKKPG